MGNLFRIETNKVVLDWSVVDNSNPINLLTKANHLPGRLAIYPKKSNLSLNKYIWCLDNPTIINEGDVGPCLYEQTNYSIYIRSKSEASINIMHRDPILLRNIRCFEKERLKYGEINFGSQIGLSNFSIFVGNEHEFDFEVEVFPTKLDYVRDYEQMITEIREIVIGLVLEYIRSTYKLGMPSHNYRSTELEWILLLKESIKNLDLALNQIARRPNRDLLRSQRMSRIERVKRPDPRLYRTIQKGIGKGKIIELDTELTMKEYIQDYQVQHTLDTSEHRWIAYQLAQIHHHLARVYQAELKREPGERRDYILNEIACMERKIARLSQIEPIAKVDGDIPQPGFASIQLLYTPGYREAYRACLILSHGLHLEGGLVNLSLKDLHLLYEYWCFIILVRLIAQELDQKIPINGLLTAEQHGLRVLLQRGKEHSISFDLPEGRKLKVMYNPRFQGELYLVPQQPDIVLNIKDLEQEYTDLFVLDAKYRIDTSADYVRQFGCAGPPIDALNALHRYRDAIMEASGRKYPKHVVRQAIALYPYSEEKKGDFIKSRLWKAIGTIGVGAIPLLPKDTCYFADWLRMILKHPWEIKESIDNY